MSMRRQRIKATANLSNIKRKPRKEDATPIVPKLEPEEKAIKPEPETKPEPKPEPELDSLAEPEQAFKMPVSSVGLQDETFHSDFEDNVIQMDLQKTSSGFPMSPSKAQARQRVRPTPSFNQRRNSFVGSPVAGDYEGDYQSPATPTRRERYLSGSSSMGTPHHQTAVGSSPACQTQYKYFPPGVSPAGGRIRTESTCSVYSEGGGKQQRGKATDDKCPAGQRVNARRDFETRFYKGVPDKSTFKMFDMIFYNPENNPMEQKPVVTTIKAESETKPTNDQLLEAKEEANAGAMPVPQLKLDANGEMIIDEKTLEIETTAEVEARKVLANSSLILMDETTGDNGFYKRHKRTLYWTSDETVRFYRSLQIIGTDFSLMCQMFPQRTRRDLKLKYKKEERTNAQLINKALLYPKAFNIQELKDQLEQEDRERKEKDRQWQEIMATQAENTKKRSKQMESKAARTLSDGDVVYENEHVTRQKMGKHAWAKRRRELKTNENGGKRAPRKRGRPKQKEPEPEPAMPPLETDQEEEQKQPSSPKPQPQVLPSFDTIKQEASIKTEQNLAPPLPTKTEFQQELNELLADDEPQPQPVDMEVEEQEEFVEEFLPLHEKTIINLDDGSLNYVSDVDSEPYEQTATPDTPAGSVSQHDIEQILADLAEGSLVLVSSLDPKHEDRVINEIYMYDKDSGELCEEPLKIPEDIVQCILNVMT